MRQRARALGFGAVLVVGCNPPMPAPEKPSAPLVYFTAPPPPTSPADAGVTRVVPDDGTIVVLDRGAEPRVALRYAFVAGRTERRLVTVHSSRSNEVPENAVSLQLVLDVTPKFVTEGEWTFEVKVVEASSPDRDPDKTKHVRPLAGVKGKLTVSLHGESSAIDFDHRSLGNGLGHLLSLLDGVLFFVPVPEIPIGRGGIWQRGFVRPSEDDAGAPGISRTKYTLTQVSPAGGVIMAESSMKMPRRPFVGPGVTPGAFLEETGHASHSYDIALEHVARSAHGENVFTRYFDMRQTAYPDKSADLTFTTKSTLETPK